MVGDKADLEQQQFTLSFWAQLNNPSAATEGGSAYEFSYRMDFTGRYLRAGITNTSNTSFGIFGSHELPVGDDGWHMWSMSVGNGNLNIYKDGVLGYSGTYNGTIDYAKNKNNFVIGARDNGSYSINGKIDDVRFYDKALSADQIGQLYHGELISLEILGPDQVVENSQAQYNAIAHYDNDSTKDVTNSASWSVEPNTNCSIATGLLTTEAVDLPQDITILAEYSEGENTQEAQKQVEIFAICPSGSALEFDGQDDYVNVPDSDDFTPNVGTVCAWIKLRVGESATMEESFSILRVT